MINEFMIETCKHEIASWAGINITDQDMKTILEGDTELVELLIEFYTFDKEVFSLDTADRDYLFDGFARFIGGTHWPCYGEDGSDYSKNFTNLLVAYEEKVK